MVQMPGCWQWGAVGPLRDAVPGLPRASPSQFQQPHHRALPGPAAKMAAPWGQKVMDRRGTGGTKSGEYQKQHQGQRRRWMRRCSMVEQKFILQSVEGASLPWRAAPCGRDPQWSREKCVEERVVEKSCE